MKNVLHLPKKQALVVAYAKLAQVAVTLKRVAARIVQHTKMNVDNSVADKKMGRTAIDKVLGVVILRKVVGHIVQHIRKSANSLVAAKATVTKMTGKVARAVAIAQKHAKNIVKIIQRNVKGKSDKLLTKTAPNLEDVIQKSLVKSSVKNIQMTAKTAMDKARKEIT